MGDGVRSSVPWPGVRSFSEAMLSGHFPASLFQDAPRTEGVHQVSVSMLIFLLVVYAFLGSVYFVFSLLVWVSLSFV